MQHPPFPEASSTMDFGELREWVSLSSCPFWKLSARNFGKKNGRDRNRQRRISIRAVTAPSILEL